MDKWVYDRPFGTRFVGYWINNRKDIEATIFRVGRKFIIVDDDQINTGRFYRREQLPVSAGPFPTLRAAKVAYLLRAEVGLNHG